MLAADLSFKDIPADHPDANQFLRHQFKPGQTFNLVIYSSSIIRNHQVGNFRQKTEPQRLATSQRALGLEQLNPSSTIVVLFYKVEA